MKQTRLPRRSAILLALAAGFMQSLALAAPVPAADVIFTGGTIVTVNEFQPQVEAIAVGGGRIVAAGYRDEVMKMKRAKTRLVDLGGMTLVPGFVDPHGHVFNTGIQAISANLLPRPDGTVNDIAEMQAALKAWAAQNTNFTVLITYSTFRPQHGHRSSAAISAAASSRRSVVIESGM
jgi:predicted amidohydrolase YtcJ